MISILAAADTSQGYMNLPTLWFALIGVLWTGFFFLEGFDFGVGILLPFISRDETERRMVVNTIGPVWDGNEVWLLVAGGATFAAFPEWYASMFSGFYFALVVVLFAISIRAFAFEFRGKVDSVKWRAWFDRMIFTGSALIPLLLGVAFANILQGLKLDSDFEVRSTFFSLLNPYALLGGVTFLIICVVHGALYISLKTKDGLDERATKFATRMSLPSALLVVFFLLWTYRNAINTDNKGVVPGFVPITAMLCVVGVAWLLRDKFNGWAFAVNGLAIALLVGTIFANLYPRAIVGKEGTASLTIFQAASTSTTLRLMTVVAILFVPVILVYQTWTYYVFRHRIGRDRFEPLKTPMDLIAEKTKGEKAVHRLICACFVYRSQPGGLLEH